MNDPCANTYRTSNFSPTTATRPEHCGSLRWASEQMLGTARALVQASLAGLQAAQAGGEG